MTKSASAKGSRLKKEESLSAVSRDRVSPDKDPDRVRASRHGRARDSSTVLHRVIRASRADSRDTDTQRRKAVSLRRVRVNAPLQDNRDRVRTRDSNAQAPETSSATTAGDLP